MLKLGIIGAGIMGQRMLRAALDQAADVVEVVGIWDPRGVDVAGATSIGTAQALIDLSACVYIASPPASHLGHAAAALAAGRAVFCEKPLAVDVAAARAFVAGAAGARAAVNFPMASSFGVATLTASTESLISSRLANAAQPCFSAIARVLVLSVSKMPTNRH